MVTEIERKRKENKIKGFKKTENDNIFIMWFDKKDLIKVKKRPEIP